MSLSRLAKRGISVFSKIQWNPKRAMYHLSQKNMISLAPQGDPKLVTAAVEAMEILVKNGEAANGNTEIVPEVQNDTIAPSAESGTEHCVPLQPQDSQEGQEGGPFGASGGVQ